MEWLLKKSRNSHDMELAELINSLERFAINKDKDLQLERDINQKWQAAQALKAPADRRELRSRFGGQVLDRAVLKELYKERERAEAKKQEKRKSQVGGVGGDRRARRWCSLMILMKKTLVLKKLMQKNDYSLIRGHQKLHKFPPHLPVLPYILATPRPQEPSTPGPKPTKTSLRYPVSSPASPTIRVTRSRRSRR